VSPRCRSCGGGDLDLVLSLGRTPLANALLSEDDLAVEEETFPLDLVFCPSCSLVQITETVPPETLFREYLYFSSFSETMLAHAEELTDRVVHERGLNGGSLVVEIASNDGYLLQYYRRAGIRVLGVEPAGNVAAVARERGVPTVEEFFDADVASGLADAGNRADVIHAHNVLAHVSDLNGFVRGLQVLAKDDGAVVIEVPYVKDMLDKLEFDTIYHEHLCYFSLTALERLFRRHDLVVERADRVPIHGGSLQLVVRPRGTEAANAGVARLLEEERAWGVGTASAYHGFADRVERLKEALTSRLGELRAADRRLAAYGAAAKGSTLLNYCGIGRETIEFVVDRSTYKQGLYMPGVRLPIHPPSKLLEEQPDYVLLLTWNFEDEILEQQADYRARGGRFIVPIPSPRVL
jgi:SAM-dependent methyltransferase